MLQRLRFLGLSAIQAPDEPWLTCPRCGMGYQIIKVEGDRCDDMSGWGGTVPRGCPGILVAT